MAPSGVILRPSRRRRFRPSGGSSGIEATLFDGSSDYLHHGTSTGFSDSKQCLMSIWFERQRINTTEWLWSAQNGTFQRVAMWFNTGNQLEIRTSNAFGGAAWAFTSTNGVGDPLFDDLDRHNLIISMDTALGFGAQRVYFDDSALSGTTVLNNGVVDFTVSDYAFAARQSNNDRHANIALALIWVDPGTWLDIDITANRRKFITAALEPVALGANGETPTGSSPKIYLPNGDGTNAGTTANFTQFGSPTTVFI